MLADGLGLMFGLEGGLVEGLWLVLGRVSVRVS